MPKIKRTDAASCSLPGLGEFDQGDERTVSDQVADQFRNATGWAVIDDDTAPAVTTTTEPPEDEGEGEDDGTT